MSDLENDVINLTGTRSKGLKCHGKKLRFLS